ncbi:translocation protein TolB [Leptospira wolffii]|uniref:PD40 domain-containing protein n=1 Tax=Leptospira wolffii TaxID=409998 RepID=UPI00108410B7|nr:PD40 domain-containing protein [Leptospira wolffii]TGK55225.1 translocation protein TolB [Leptospira wolffii]TGK65734.1 translocation protein TolB [Leptospira wolffii]TGK70474.1 translocation protein TolB [Leptospira wolffii]TGL29990.1 translocation protein TolB [Leptospira wolffii]
MRRILCLTLTFFLVSNCMVFRPVQRIKPIEFDYGPISKNYFSPENDKPFPLTVQRGNNLYNSTTKDGRYLFYTTGQKGNYDIWFRDLKSSIVVPITEHPSSEYKPAISPNGKKLAFVSEQYDSAGDIVVLELEPEVWASRILEGKRFLSDDFQFITNHEYRDPARSDRFSDTDPIWAPDSRRILFSSDRMSPGIPNLILWDTEGEEKPRLLTRDGAASPFWSQDANTIVYLSYSDSSKGEIYSLDIRSGKSKRLTSDDYLDFSPSLSPDGNFLYYTSIRKDSDGNRILDERDNSVIIRLDLRDGKERKFSSGNFSLFDTKYSDFNGGSILFTASFYGTLNIYFLPVSGSVPKATDISAQLELAKEYGEKQSLEDYLLALDSVDLYYRDDPLYFVYRAKVLAEKVRIGKKLGKSDAESKKEMSQSRLDPKAGLAYAYYLQSEGNAKSLREYYLALKKVPTVDPQVLASLAEEIGGVEEASGNKEAALRTWEDLHKRFPNYYRNKEILRKIGSLQLREGRKKSWRISDLIRNTANDPNAKTEDLRNLYEFLEAEVLSGKTDAEKMEIADLAESTNSLSSNSPVLHRFFRFLKANGLTGTGKFSESNRILDPFYQSLKSTDPMYFKAHLLRSENFRGLGDTKNSLEEFRIFLENYDHASGVSIEDKEMERFFIYFENLARNYENRSDYEQAALHYFYNTLNMFIAKSKNLFTGSVYKDYAVYYEKLMIESSFKYAKSVSEKGTLALLGDLNPLDYDPLDRSTGLKYLNEYFERQPTVKLARGNLDLATLYGYAYYLINRSVIRETYYYSAGTISTAKKEEALRDYKQAEYELRWIIFADPTYHEAYQLLGWLYQYVDIMKSRRPSDQEASDEEVYKNEYQKYFPEKNFEENIELYSQILELLGEKFPNKKVLSDLKLNLGNNYFLLKNYPKADEQYSSMESYSNHIVSKAQFENYRQKAVFLFNSARASMYMSKYQDAVRKLKAAAELYSKNEFPLLHTGSDSKKNLESYREKLGLIYTLTGLSYMEAGEFSNAIPYYLDSLELNEPSRLVDPVNLRNALAICYQKIGEISESEKQLKIAEDLMQSKGIRWFPRRVNPKFWDYLWELVFDAVLPDSTRISGSGRFPEAIPPKFQPLLSAGIRINNLALENNYSSGVEEIEKRLSYVSRQGLKNTLAGQLIASQSYGDLGFFKYRRNEFRDAKESYESGRNYEKNTPDLAGRAGSSFKRYLYSLFAEIESKTDGSDFDAEKELNSALADLESVKSSYLLNCMVGREEDYLQGRPRCSESFYREYYDYDILLANLLYYSGEERLKKGEWVQGFEDLGRASTLLEYPSGLSKEVVGLAQDPFSRKERVMHALSRASVYFRLGDLEKTKASLAVAEEMANEFYLVGELIQTWALQARLELVYGQKEKARQKLKYAQEMLRKQFHIVSENKSFLLRDLYETKIRLEFETGNFIGAFQEWDRLQKLMLFRNFQKGNWEFSEAQKEYLKFESDWKDFRQSYLKFQTALETKGDIKKDESELNRTSARVLESLKILRGEFSDRASFLDPFGEWKESNLPVDASEFRLLEIRGKILLRIRSRNGSKFLTFSGESKALDEIQNLTEWKSSSKNLVDPGNTSLGPIIAERFPKTVFRFSVSPENSAEAFLPKTVASFGKIAQEPGNRKISGFYMGSNLEDSDIIISPFPEIKGDSYFGEKRTGHLDLSELFNKKHRARVIILTYDSLPSWGKIQKGVQAILGSGASAVFLCSNSGLCEKEILEEIRGGKESVSAIRFGTLPVRGGNQNAKAEKLFYESREKERRGEYKEAFADLHSARSLAVSGSDSAFKIEANLLRIYPRIHADLDMDRILSLRYENRTPEKYSELVFSLCLSLLLDTKEKDCKGISLAPSYSKSIEAIMSLKSGKDPGSVLNEKNDSNFYDPFLYRIRLFRLALEAYLPSIAENQLRMAKTFVSSNEESDLWKKENEDLRRQVAFLEEKEEISDFDSSSEPEGSYASRLYILQKRKILGGRISPLGLYSELYNSSYRLLETLDSGKRSYVLDLLRYSLSEEENKEMSDFIEDFSEFEGDNGNLPRRIRVMIEISRAYFSRGDFEKSRKWIDKASSLGPGTWTPEIEFVKLKLDAMSSRPFSASSDLGFAEYSNAYAEALRSKSKTFLDLANRWVKSRKKRILSPRERRELNDFIHYLQFLSFKQNDSETFFDLCIAKDRISSVRSILLGRLPTYSDIPVFNPISDELEKKIPEGQEFLAVTDLGLSTFYIKFTRGKSNGELAFKDNRKIRNLIAKYNEEADKGGAEVLLREAVETEIRKNIRIAKNKTTYLYLSSYYFLSPLIPKSEDDVYYVTDPESLLKNPLHKESSEFPKDFGILTKDTNAVSEWYKQLIKLENMELSEKGRTGSDPFQIVRIPLYTDSDRSVKFGGVGIADANPPTISGTWMLSSSFLEELANGSGNLKDSLYYLFQNWKGVGIVNLGFQADTHNARFLKEMVSRKESSQKSLRARFLKTMDAMKEYYPLDKYWNGYRLFTTSFISKVQEN